MSYPGYFHPRSGAFKSGIFETDDPPNASTYRSKLIETRHLPGGDLEQIWENTCEERFIRIKKYGDAPPVQDCILTKKSNGDIIASDFGEIVDIDSDTKN